MESILVQTSVNVVNTVNVVNVEEDVKISSSEDFEMISKSYEDKNQVKISRFEAGSEQIQALQEQEIVFLKAEFYSGRRQS